MNGDPALYQQLKELSISFDYFEHPPTPTDLCTRLVSRYSVSPEQCQVEVLEFLNQVLENGLVQVEPRGAQ